VVHVKRRGEVSNGHKILFEKPEGKKITILKYRMSHMSGAIGELCYLAKYVILKQ
jgi:hypothetical protein